MADGGHVPRMPTHMQSKSLSAMIIVVAALPHFKAKLGVKALIAPCFSAQSYHSAYQVKQKINPT